MGARNCWCVAAWSHEISAETGRGRTIINIPLLLWRAKIRQVGGSFQRLGLWIDGALGIFCSLIQKRLAEERARVRGLPTRRADLQPKPIAATSGLRDADSPHSK
jgi:hypothetical protein